MHPKRMMIIGVILLLAAIALFAYAPYMIGQEETSIKKAIRFDGDATGAAGPEKLVIVEGIVSAKNKLLIHDFVDAAKEYQAKGGSWSILELYRQPVLADLARGGIILASDTLCTAAKGDNVLETDERDTSGRKIRYTGLRRGDPITAIGTLTTLTPANLAVSHWYSGSMADYQRYLASSRKGLYIFCAVIAAAGAVFFLIGLRKR